MDEIENAINEARRVGEPGEKLWLPSAPRSSPEKTLLSEAAVPSPSADKTTFSSEPLERENLEEQRVRIARFTVTKTPVNSPSGDTTNKTFKSPVTAEDHKQVMQGKETSAPADSEANTTTTTTDSSSSTKTTATAPTQSPGSYSLPGTEEGEKTLGGIATQTEDMEQQTSERTLTTLALLQEAVKEIKTMIAPSSIKESGRFGFLVKLRGNKYCTFCLMVVFLLCVFVSFMWLLSTLSTSSGSQLNTTIDSINILAESEQQQLHQELEVRTEEEVAGSASKVVQNSETEGHSDSEEIHSPSLTADGTDTDEEVMESTGGGEVGMETTESFEDELLEEDNDKQLPFIRQSNMEHEQSEDIDGQSLEGEQITKAANIKPMILRVIYLKTHQCQEGGKVLLARYVDMYRHLLNFFHIFGTFATVQERMLESRLVTLERYIRGRDSQHYTTLATMIQFEDATGRIGSISPFSGTTLFTCLQRHLQFISHCLANVLPLSPDMSLLHAFRAAYQEVLAIHHAWFVKNFYLAGFGTLPTKQVALDGVASVQWGDDDTSPDILHNSILAIVLALDQLTQASEFILINTNALQKIPKQVIT